MPHIIANLNKTRLAISSMAGQVRDMGSRFVWIMLVVALAEFLPWMLFLSGIVFSPESPSDNLPVLLIIYMVACFAGYPLSIQGPIDKKVNLRGQTILGCVLIAAGIALVYVGGAVLPMIGLQIAGIVMCALGKDQLMARWYAHFSRMSSSMTTCMTSCGIAFLAILYVVLTFMANPARIVLVIAIYLIVPLAASAQVRDYAPLGRQWADSHAAAEAFALQSRKSIIALTMSIAVIFGYCSMMVASSGFFLRPDLDVENTAALLALCAGAMSLICLVVVLSLKNTTSVLLDITCACLIIGIFALSAGMMHHMGVVLMVFGFVIVDRFYCAFYGALCHLKKLRDNGAGHILRFSYKFIPLGIALGGVLRLLVERYVSGFDSEVEFVLGCILLLTLLCVHSREISSTRKETVDKSYSSISLDDIKRFAKAHAAEYGLSDRECEIIHCFMNGRSVHATSQELFISENTVKSHTATIYRKLGVHKREELISKVSRGVKE